VVLKNRIAGINTAAHDVILFGVSMHNFKKNHLTSKRKEEKLIF
jgi:hypothetical protein